MLAIALQLAPTVSRCNVRMRNAPTVSRCNGLALQLRLAPTVSRQRARVNSRQQSLHMTCGTQCCSAWLARPPLQPSGKQRSVILKHVTKQNIGQIVANCAVENI